MEEKIDVLIKLNDYLSKLSIGEIEQNWMSLINLTQGILEYNNLEPIGTDVQIKKLDYKNITKAYAFVHINEKNKNTLFKNVNSVSIHNLYPHIIYLLINSGIMYHEFKEYEKTYMFIYETYIKYKNDFKLNHIKPFLNMFYIIYSTKKETNFFRIKKNISFLNYVENILYDVLNDNEDYIHFDIDKIYTNGDFNDASLKKYNIKYDVKQIKFLMTFDKKKYIYQEEEDYNTITSSGINPSGDEFDLFKNEVKMYNRKKIFAELNI
jgi:hypothetical protein